MSQDIKPGWLNVARHMQAAASKGNGEGFAIVNIRVMVLGNEPMFWFQATTTPIHPMGLKDIKMDAKLLGVLAKMAEDTVASSG